MPKKQVPVWKAQAKKSDLSPKELMWEERRKQANLEANYAARQKRAERKKMQDALEVPHDVVEWFDRSRVSFLAALDDKQK
eukprot:CAMPEP_0206254060 /NCGR_PEP_ID=MMETSP0047_2-20121206/23493_1 /ASSEMBLY_ACC=CAM_ASM_000192 /TAXON_ID=195065 /ORGANISM="Chroomonas mesostigmatica_cf, Strain CCMP1168" /LENGTH=80 /DNA_ID=CAMNT_0053680329 /DNA_START=323 /DNA_END=562 /DNA_ORIENTATION=+